MEKKIKIVVYLNKETKPKKNLKGQNCYRVYLRFNNAKTNHRISFNKIGYLSSEEDLLKYKELIDLETNYINEFIKFNNGKFDALKYNEYLYSIDEIDRGLSINQFSNVILKEQLNKINTIIEKRNSTFIDKQDFINNTNKLIDISINFQNLIDDLECWNKKVK